MLRDALIAVLNQGDADQAPLVTRHQLAEQKRQNLRILLAEDNPINQKLAVTLLQKAGYSVEAVESGLQALEKAKTGGYHAILMDVQMSEMDGFEATRLIRDWELQTGVRTPIIAMTAHALSGDRERCLEAGMDDYLSKPLQPKVFFSMVERWSNVEARSASAPTPTVPVAEPNEYNSIQEPLFEDDGLFGEESVPNATRTKSVTYKRHDFSNFAPMDLQAALVHFDGDKKFMMEMFDTFLRSLAERLAEMRSTAQEKDSNKLARLAHNLKGACLNFGTEPLATLCKAVEELGKQDDLQFALDLLQQMQEEIVRLKGYAEEKL